MQKRCLGRIKIPNKYFFVKRELCAVSELCSCVTKKTTPCNIKHVYSFADSTHRVINNICIMQSFILLFAAFIIPFMRRAVGFNYRAESLQC